MSWEVDSVEFVYRGDLGAVTLSAVLGYEGWRSAEGWAHRPQRGVHRYLGVCPYVDGACESIEIDKSRVIVPIKQWVRRDHDPAVVEKVMAQWYEEFVNAHES